MINSIQEANRTIRGHKARHDNPDHEPRCATCDTPFPCQPVVEAREFRESFIENLPGHTDSSAIAFIANTGPGNISDVQTF